MQEEENTLCTRGLSSSSRLKLPRNLPSIEGVMKRLMAVLDALEQPRLDIVEAQTLGSIIQEARICKGVFADYVDCRGIGGMLLGLRRKYDRLAKKAEEA